MGTVEDVAEVAVFLASEASGFLTGQVIHASGGLVVT
jgi:NAD(P)-dependent dehydrogenase (short-subunit alcohol dehydrogenase family)